MSASPSADELLTALVHIWSDALRVHVAPESDFFALGGTSLEAIVIANELAFRYEGHDGIELCALEAVFTSSSVEGMARALAKLMQSRSSGAHV